MADYVQINHRVLEIPERDVIGLFFFLFFVLKYTLFPHVPKEVWQLWTECEESTGEKWAYKNKN